MAYIIKTIYNNYEQMVAEHADPIMDNLFFMGSPVKMLSVTLLYYLFVKKIGPKFMSTRQPYNVRKLMLAFDLFQIIVNLYCVYLGTLIITQLPSYHDWSCMRVSRPHLTQMEAHAFYLYYFIKITDYMDTVFMVLRKNYRQITFLHVYHHMLMVVATYFGLRLTTNDHTIMLGYINAFVHVIMYSYYFLAALRPGIRESVTLKRHITHLQLAQFGYLLVYFTRGLLNEQCWQNHAVMWFALLQAVVMIILFTNFYIKTYIKNAKTKTVKAN